MTDTESRKAIVKPQQRRICEQHHHPLQRGILISFITGGLGAAMMVAFQRSALDATFSIIASACAMMAFGGMLSVILLVSPYQKERKAFRAYIDKLIRFDLRDRRSSFDILKNNSDGLINELSDEVHRIVTDVYANHAEAVRIRRNMDDAVRAETARATAKLNKEVLTDPLTQLHNRRSFDAALPELFQIAKSRKEDIVCMMIDVDHFKNINDCIGHDAGDEVLKGLATVLQSIVRESDMAFRLGGDEFVVLFINTTTHEVFRIADRLQKRFAQLPWKYDETQCKRATLSIGGVSLQLSNAATPELLLKQADYAMLDAKKCGKNRAHIIGVDGIAA